MPLLYYEHVKIINHCKLQLHTEKEIALDFHYVIFIILQQHHISKHNDNVGYVELMGWSHRLLYYCQSGVSRKTLTVSKHKKPSLQHSVVRAFSSKVASFTEDKKLFNICFQEKARKGWHKCNVYAVWVLNKVSP